MATGHPFVSAFRQGGPVPVKARQARRGEHDRRRMGVDGARGDGEIGHTRPTSRASKMASQVSATGTSGSSDRR